MPSPSQPAQERALSRENRRWYQRAEARAREHPDLIAAAVVTLGFCWRLWLAQATFFNTDEAWHYSLANQDSLLHAYKASLTISHPPLLILVLYFWRALGTSNLVLRLPSVIAGTLLGWVSYKWIGRLCGRAAAWAALILLTFLPPMIALSADLRQYMLMLLFSVSAAYFLERALAENSGGMMVLSTVFLYLGLLSHYSAFLFAASLGLYCILRMIARRPPARLIALWSAGQIGGVALAAFLYVTQIRMLGTVYPGAQPLHRYAEWYLADWYFHPGKDHLLPFFYRGTFGVFRFGFGQTAIGQAAALMFFAGVFLLLRRKATDPVSNSSRAVGVLLLLPFGLNCVAVAAGLYPYGRTRQCVYLAIFGIAGVSVALARLAKEKVALAAVFALVIALGCQASRRPQDRDMLPLADQRHENMDRALGFIRAQNPAPRIIFVDKATSFQLGHYLCQQRPYAIDRSAAGFESFQCGGLQIVSTGPNDGALSADNFVDRWRDLVHSYAPTGADHVLVMQGGWASGLAEALRARSQQFAGLQPHAFGHYIEIFDVPAAEVAAR